MHMPTEYRNTNTARRPWFPHSLKHFRVFKIGGQQVRALFAAAMHRPDAQRVDAAVKTQFLADRPIANLR
jgi:hypothetical protein